jgi:hypothetical protein
VTAVRDERRHSAHPPRLPRRPTDRVEDLAAWVLTTLALLTTVLAVFTASRLYFAQLQRVEVETRERTQVQAVLLEPARGAFQADHRGQGVRPLPVTVAVRFVAPDGAERRADAKVVGPLPAGVTVPIWLDRSGAVTDAPADHIDAVMEAVTGGGTVLVAGGAVLGGLWWALHSWLLRLNTARWGREWAQVEPQWSRRMQR